MLSPSSCGRGVRSGKRVEREKAAIGGIGVRGYFKSRVQRRRPERPEMWEGEEGFAVSSVPGSDGEQFWYLGSN